MKGSLHTDELMAEVVRKDIGLRTERRISHVFIMDVPTYAKPLAVTDAAINIFPDLETKVDIVQNAIEMAHALGRELPKVAILSAVETVTPKIPSTIDAAALCKMAERGQITGALLDGPLAFDNAISKEAAEIKGIRSEVAGDADILVVPDLEAGNMLAKQLSFLANADAAGIVLGARADHPDLARRHRARAHGILRGRRSARPCPSAGERARGGVGGLADAVLTINAGSSSLKFSVYRIGERAAGAGGERQVEGIGTAPHLVAEDAEGRVLVERRWPDDAASGHDEFFRVIGGWLREHFGDREALLGVGHRVVHGGTEFAAPVRVSPAVLARLEALCPLAPCISRTISPASARLRRSSPTCRRWPASTPRSTAAIPSLPTGTPCRAGSTTTASAATASTACPTSTSRACCPRSRRKLPRARGGRASRQRRQHVRHPAGRSMDSTMGFTALDGLPWARAAARSIRASCSTCSAPTAWTPTRSRACCTTSAG